jgi:hypothetical protein
MIQEPWMDGEDPNSYFSATFAEVCGHFEDGDDRGKCFDQLVADWASYEPWRVRPPLDSATIDWITGASDDSPAGAQQEQSMIDLTDAGEERVATPRWARIFADIGFFVSVAFLVWMIHPFGRNYSLPTTVEGGITLLVGIAFLLVCAFLINLLPIVIVAQSTPFGARQYDTLERWLGWLWKWRKRPVDVEWAKIAPYSGTVYADYLQSEQWRKRREILLRKADHRCQLCNSKDQLQAHHRTYDRIFKEEPNDLVVLCRSCHERFHNISRR